MSESKNPSVDVPSLDTIPEAVHRELRHFLDARRAEITEIGQPVTTSIEFLESFVLGGGKRIRPLYAWAGFVGAGGLKGAESPEAMLRAASSLEFIQACALIHDDIVDDSDTRRGNPTVHRGVAARHRDLGHLGNSEFFGQSIAILVGDMALVWAEDMLQDSGLSAAALSRARAPWRGMRQEVIGGQILDIALEATGSEDPALSDSVNRFKTAAYTIERPLHLGAAIAGADASLIDAFRGYGRDIGIAFQLRDDQLGVFGDPAITGKPAGDDLREGKRTVLLSLALQRADEQDPAAAATLRRLIGNTEDPAEIAQMAQIIADSGAPELLEQRIDALTQSGLSHLHAAQVDPEVTATLEALAIKSTARRM
ncbi:polyprenyl synthetase family protein [Corynebacterium sp.]|uniref:polyprenyl synthetase family protein n=1 Tax=Corynebacterium sp. TaxID=1720 RepID=UPI0026DD6F6D|nr:polyprenyl synthetase family protein [Corynebacterium sp.]MDO5031377.1 polyprenyl synthetase family protein [Corynebacterium sp.]